MILTADIPGERLDAFLARCADNLSRSAAQKLIEDGQVTRNGKPGKKNDKLNMGDEIRVRIPEPKTVDITAREMPLDIVYEDENILLVSKRPGVSVHEDEDGGNNNLITHIQAYLYQKGEYRPEDEQSFAPALCNRIDRNTAGLVIAAKTASALRFMNEKIKNDEIRTIIAKDSKNIDQLTLGLKVRKLIDTANENGGADNITAALIKL